ncbi:hypothetical protein HCU64_14225 [Methylobacterium sp. C25]|uniref:hypothetical protein n=1 Tax=Methylobacterium sp. C25 TaxID=2721622 RepID=UPI001F23582B|nr:hypothetical protein [Methylobacterium sp. C25]MCE4224916.1 hypothetical protein [Methylobacterium sp. C25]
MPALAAAPNDAARLDAFAPWLISPEQGPAWAGGLSLPSPIYLAIRAHHLCWEALCASSAAFDAAGETEWKQQDWGARDAESQAAWIVLKTPCGSREGAAALVEHLEWYLAADTQHPGGDGPDSVEANSARLADLRMLLGAGPETAEGPMLAAIEANRSAWSALLAAAAERGDARWEAEGEARSTAYEIKETSCGSRAGAAALREHLEVYLPALAARELDGAAGFEGALAARLADLRMLLGESSSGRVPGRPV